MRQQFTFIAVLALLTACGGGGGGDSTVATSSGVFVNSPTKGITYFASPSGLTGTTDENGTYSYKSGDTVTFSTSTSNLGGVPVDAHAAVGGNLGRKQPNALSGTWTTAASFRSTYPYPFARHTRASTHAIPARHGTARHTP